MAKIGRPRLKFQIHKNPSGYREAVWWARGRRFRAKLHRYIMEKKLGRKLKPEEQIHHKDHKRANNKMKNLRVIMRAAHTALENTHRAGKGLYQGIVRQQKEAKGRPVLRKVSDARSS